MATTTMHGTYYSDRFEGRKTSSGEVFSQQKFTAAHNSLPFGTLLLVTNPNNGRQVIVRINDRCPKRNILDMSRRAAKQIGIGSLTIQVTKLPDRFYPYWESQDQFVDVMMEGGFWEFAKATPAPKPKPEQKTELKPAKKTVPASKPSSTQPQKPRSTTAAKTTKTTTPREDIVEVDVKLYDIELCRCKSRNTAKKKVEQMPIYYQDKVDYKSNIGTNEVIIMLLLSLREDKALSVINELSGLFPDAKLVKSNR